jgi:protoheme IX farnesyltransferase
MKSSEAVLFSGLSLVVGTLCLGLINPLTAFIGMCSFMLYAFVYTPLKRYSTLSVAIGAIPGALPVLIGAVAFDGTFTILALTLFLIQFLWQFPHFWAIAYLSFDDYDRAGYKLLPLSESGSIDRNLGTYSAIYALLIIPTVVWAYLSGVETHIVAMALVVLCTLIYAAMAILMQMKPSRKTALGLMFSSFFYLPIVLALYLIG